MYLTIPTYQPTNQITYLLTYLPTYLLTYFPICLSSQILAYLSTYLLTYLSVRSSILSYSYYPEYAYISSDIRAGAGTDKRIGQARRNLFYRSKTSVGCRQPVSHLSLLC